MRPYDFRQSRQLIGHGRRGQRLDGMRPVGGDITGVAGGNNPATAQALPFTLLSLDTDHRTVFVNDGLVEYCAKHSYGLTRPRPCLKNDQAWIVSENGSVVRRIVGYGGWRGSLPGRQGRDFTKAPESA